VRLVDEPLRGVKVLSPEVYEDSRGFFMESYNRRRFAELGIDCDFVQDNHSRSSLGVLRGLHYQLDRAQAKLVRTTRGSVFDVVVDIRHGSPSFGEWVGIELSEENRLQLFAPEGFAHGFLVLSEVAEFQYKCSDFYSMKDLSGRDCEWSSLAKTSEDDLPAFGDG